MAIFNLKDWFSGLTGPKFTDWLTSFISGYGRRMAEPYYDRIAQTDFFQKLKAQDKPLKYFLEALNNAITSIIDLKIDEATPLRKIIKEIFMDSSSELNKRLLNGESVKSLLGSSLESLDPKSQGFISVLLLLEEEKLKNLLKWIISMSDKERLNVLKTFQSLSPEDMAKLSELSPEMKDLFFRAFEEPKKPNPLRGFTKPFKERMIHYLEKKGG